jgi:hypothetical protein
MTEPNKGGAVRLAAASATLSLSLLAVMVGCDQLTQQKPPAPVAKTKPRPTNMAHRFVLTKLDGGVAFDTQTGQICKTWGWEPTGKPAAVDPSSGMVPQRSFGEFAPTCLSLYQQYPSSPDSAIEAISDEN